MVTNDPKQDEKVVDSDDEDLLGDDKSDSGESSDSSSSGDESKKDVIAKLKSALRSTLRLIALDHGKEQTNLEEIRGWLHEHDEKLRAAADKARRDKLPVDLPKREWNASNVLHLKRTEPLNKSTWKGLKIALGAGFKNVGGTEEEFLQLLEKKRTPTSHTCAVTYNLSLTILHNADKKNLEIAVPRTADIFKYLIGLEDVYGAEGAAQAVQKVQELLDQHVEEETSQAVIKFGILYSLKVGEIETITGHPLDHMLQICGYLRAFPKGLNYIKEYVKVNVDLKTTPLDQIRKVVERLAVNHSVDTKTETSDATKGEQRVALQATHSGDKRPGQADNRQHQKRRKVRVTCSRCGAKGHTGKECRVSKNHRCDKCHNIGHFSHMCTSRGRHRNDKKGDYRSRARSRSPRRRSRSPDRQDHRDRHQAFMVHHGRQATLEAKAVIDSGATISLSPDATLFRDLRPAAEDLDVTTANGATLTPEGVGTLEFQVTTTSNELATISIPGALYIPAATHTLVSVHDLTANGARLSFAREGSTLHLADSKSVHIPADNKLRLLRSPRHEALLVQDTHHNALLAKLGSQILHQRLGHLSTDILRKTVRVTANTYAAPVHTSCTTCALANIDRTPGNHGQHEQRATAPCQAATADVVGPFTPSPDGYSYSLNFRDLYSDIAQCYPMKALTDVTDALRQWRRDWLGHQAEKSTCRLYLDSAAYFVHGAFRRQMDEWGWALSTSTPHYPASHPAERINRTLHRMTRAALQHSGLPRSVWHYAYLASTYVYNRCAKKRFDTTPMERHFGRVPSTQHLRVFGCISVVRQPAPVGKLEPRGTRGIFLGYDRRAPYGTYVVYNISTRRILRSRDVSFFETDFPTPADIRALDPAAPPPEATAPRQHHFPAFRALPLSAPPPAQRDAPASQPTPPAHVAAPPEHPARGTLRSADVTETDNSAPDGEAVRRDKRRRTVEEEHKKDRTSKRREPDSQATSYTRDETRAQGDTTSIVPSDESTAAPSPAPETRTRSGRLIRPAHHVNIQDMTGPAQHHRYFANVASIEGQPRLNADGSPKSFSDFLKMRPSVRSTWQDAVDTERDNIVRSGTLEMVPRSAATSNIMRSIWIFKVKSNLSHKARLVIQGYDEPIEDHNRDVYAPCVETSTIRIATIIALTLDLQSTTVDISAAFLQSTVDADNLYIECPEGFSAPPNHVFRLRKSLYGLRSSPRRWHDHLARTLSLAGLQPSVADKSLFFGTRNSVPIFATVHVDDIRIFSSLGNIRHVVSTLKEHYGVTENAEEESTYLGHIWHFHRGRPATCTISQAPFAKAILQKFRMENCNPCQTPMEPGSLLSNEKDLRATRESQGSDTGTSQPAHHGTAGPSSPVQNCPQTGRSSSSHSSQSAPTDALSAPKRVEQKRDLVDPSEQSLKLYQDGSTQHPLYRSIVGSLNFLSQNRPDLCFAMHSLSRHQHDNGQTHYRAAKRVLRYVKETKDLRLTLRACDSIAKLGLAIQVFCDASYAPRHSAERKSTSAYVVAIGSSAVKWSTKQAPTTSSSVFEAELLALFLGVTAAISVREKLESLNIQTGTVQVYTDNQTVKSVLEKGNWSEQTSHLSIRYFKLMQLVKRGDINIHHIDGQEQPADALTKALPRPAFRKLTSAILNAQLPQQDIGQGGVMTGDTSLSVTR